MKAFGQAAFRSFLGFFVLIGASASAQETPVPEAKTFITIHTKDLAPESAMDELSKASGIPMRAGNDSVWQTAKNVTLDADKQPFWSVVQEFQRQSGTTIQPVNGQDGMELMLLPAQPGTAQMPQLSRGAFFFTAMSAYRIHQIGYQRPDQPMSTSYIRIRAMVDPQVKVLSYMQQMEMTEVLDEKGNSLMPPPPPPLPANVQRNRFVQLPSSIPWFEMEAMMNYLPAQGKTIKSLKGTARFQIVSKEETWEIAELANAVGSEKKFAGGKYTISGLSPSPPQQMPATYQVRILAEVDSTAANRNGGASPLTDVAALRQSIHITDGLSRELRVRTSSARGTTATARELTLSYALAGDPNDVNSLPTKLEWRIPVEITEIAVPIEFTDLPIP